MGLGMQALLYGPPRRKARVTLPQDPETGKSLRDEWLVAEMGTLFLAGFETTGHTMAWTLYDSAHSTRRCQSLHDHIARPSSRASSRALPAHACGQEMAHVVGGNALMSG